MQHCKLSGGKVQVERKCKTDSGDRDKCKKYVFIPVPIVRNIWVKVVVGIGFQGVALGEDFPLHYVKRLKLEADAGEYVEREAFSKVVIEENVIYISLVGIF